MKKLLLLICTLFTPLILLSMQEVRFLTPEETVIVNALRKKFSVKVKSTLRPTTQIYLDRNPKSAEAQVLSRYINSFVDLATIDSIQDLSQPQVNNQYEALVRQIPATPSSLTFILTGVREKRGGGLSGCGLCSGEWRVELKKIEDQIAQREQNRSRAGCIVQ